MRGKGTRGLLVAWLAFGLIFSGATARAAISVDAVSTSKVTNLVSLTFSHTVGSGANRLLIVGVTMTKGTKTCDSVTYGGTALTLIGVSQTGDAVKAYLWKLASPPSGAANVVVTCSAAENFAAGAMSFTNVDISSPNGTFAAASGTSTGPSVSVNSATGDLVVDAVASAGDGVSLAVGASQTLQWTNKTGTAGGNALGGGSIEAGAASVTMSWTLGASKDWSIGGVSLKHAPAIQADVATTKTGASTVVAGANLTYTITITNAGPNTATNVAVTDTLPGGVAFFSASSGGTSNNGAVTWSAFNLAANTSTNFTLTVTAPGSGSMTNTVSSSATTYDPDPSNNDGTVSGAKVVTTVTPQGSAGGADSSCVTATNVATRTWSHPVSSGNNRILIVGIALADNSQTVSSITYGGVALTRITTSVARNTVDLWRLVAPTVGTANIVANWTGNKDMAGWSGTFTNVDQTNPIGNSQIANGNNGTPTVTVSAASGDLVVDMLSANGDAGTVTIGGGQTLICSGQTGTGTGDCRGFSSYEAGAASVTMSWSQTANKDWDIAAAVLKVAAPLQADVATTKTGASTVYATSNLTYTISVTNHGPAAASNVVVSDILPTNVVFVSASSGGTSNNGTVTWPTMTNFASLASTSFTVIVTAPFSGLMTNTVSSTSTTSDPDASNNNGSSSGAKVISTILQIADVRTTKTGAASVYETSNLTYTITVTNLGPNTATNVIVSDLLPTNVTFVSATSGGTNGNGTVWWPTLTNWPSGSTTNFTVIITAPSTGRSLTNIVSSTATSTDPDASNNNGTASNAKVVTTVTPIADVKTTKSGATTVYATSNLTYTITVTNMGPDIATNLIVSDLLPTNVTFVSATSGGTNGNGTVWWPTMTNFAIGATTNFTVTITAPTNGVSLTNIVSSTNTTTDPDLSNNDGSASTARVITAILQIADVKATKSGAASVYETSNLTYTITVTNLGPNTATNVIVSDLLPTNVTFVSATSGGTNGNGTVWWPTMTNWPSGSTTNFTVIITAPGTGRSLTNTVSSTATSTDPDASNNNGTASNAKVITTVTPLADLKTTKSGAGGVLAGNNLTYTIAVTNLGPSTASNVVVSDLLPTNVTLVSASSGGTNGNGTVWWPTLTSLASGAITNYTVTITAPLSIVSLTNTASGTSATSDPDASNNDGSAAAAKVITSVTGVTVSGFVYLDANHNLQKDSGEAGTALTLYAKIFATTNASGPALQAAAVNGTTGAYSITNVVRGSYIIVIDDNNTLADVTPTIPSGWTGTEMPTQTRNPVAVSTVDLPNQNFGLIHSLGLTGKVFKDTGAVGGTANDGTVNGGETGLGGVTVRLTDSTGATVHDTATTDGSGNYTLLIPNSVTNGATLKVTQTNLPVHLSTGASVGDTGGTYSRVSDTVTFTYTSGASYSGVNFGDVPDNSFVNVSQQANLPGTFVLHPHSFTAGSGGSLSLSVASLPNPSISGWSQVIYRDANCNGLLDPGETAVTGVITVSAGDKVCILIKEFIPGIAPFNAQDQLTVTAAFTWTGASPALTTNTTRIDLTTVGNPTTAGLTLVKAVDKETALPGEVLTYTVTYANHSSAALTNIVVFDNTPAFTTFSSAGHGTLPNSVTGIAVTSPGVGASGAIQWTFTGSLAPASTSTVTFSVTVSQ